MRAAIRLLSAFMFITAVASACASSQPSRIEVRQTGAYVTGEVAGFTGQMIVLNDEDNIQAFDVSADLRTVVATRHVATFYDWSLYGVSTGRMGADGVLCHSEFDPNGVVFYKGTSQIVTISHDGIARLWDVPKQKELWRHRVDPYKKRLAGLTLAADGRIAFCDADGFITVAKPEPGAGQEQTLVAHWKAHDGECRGLTFTPDGGYLYSGGWDKTVAVWDADDGTLGRRIDVGFFVNGLALDRRGKRLAVATSIERPELNFEIGTKVKANEYGTRETGNGVTVLDADTGDVISVISGPRGPVTAVAISPDGRYVAAGGWEFAGRLYDAADGRKVGEVVTSRPIQALKFMPNGGSLVIGSWTPPYSGDPSLIIYPLAFRDAKLAP